MSDATTGSPIADPRRPSIRVTRQGAVTGVLVAMILALVIGGIVWFDYLGLIDAKAFLAPAYRVLGIKTRQPGAPSADSAALLEEERYAKRLEALQVRAEELDARNADLDKSNAEVAQKTQELEDRSKALDDKEKSFNDKLKQYDNRKANIDQNAQYLVGMPPAKAVEILKSMDDQTVIDIFHSVEEQARIAGETSLVSVWLSSMPADRSAAIQRKMALKPSSLD